MHGTGCKIAVRTSGAAATLPAVVTFDELCTAMDAAGVEVRVALREDGRHILELHDFHRARSLTHVVVRSFDATAAAICCSLALCADCKGTVGDGPVLAARWPELAELARRRVRASS